ncbi:MAG: non-heme iron oxygenase ferredoxin subunit [Burkholderiales bacterium]
MADWMDVAPAADLPPGTWRTAESDGTAIVVFNVDGTLYAIENVCTHDGGRLTGGEVQGDEIVCPRHGARFCVKTGAALSPPAYEPTATFPVRVEGGIVQVRDDRWD